MQAYVFSPVLKPTSTRIWYEISGPYLSCPFFNSASLTCDGKDRCQTDLENLPSLSTPDGSWRNSVAVERFSAFQFVASSLNRCWLRTCAIWKFPAASVYVIDAHAARQATGALLGNILDRHADARLLVVGDNLKEDDSYALLRQGVKGNPELFGSSRTAAPRACLWSLKAVFGCRERFFRVSSTPF